MKIHHRLSDYFIAPLLAAVLLLAVVNGCTDVAAASEVGRENPHEIMVGGWSYHWVERGRGEEWNERHYALGVQFGNGWQAATFVNSEGNRAGSLGYSHDPFWRSGRWSANWYTAVWGGYEDMPGRLMPVAAVRTRYSVTDTLHIDLNWTPVVAWAHVSITEW